MKIALVSPYTLPQCRGNSILAQRLLDGLRRRGHCAELFNSQTDEPSSLTEFRPQCIHSLHALRPVPWLRQSGLIPGVSWVVTFTGTDYNHAQLHSQLSPETVEVLGGALALTVFHDDAAQYIGRRYPVLTKLVHTIPQGVTPYTPAEGREGVRRKYDIAPEEIVFFIASGLRPVKNIPFALEAFTDIQRACPAARLLLVGPILDEQEARTVLDAGRHMPGFRYLGELPYLQTRELMTCADIFLNTSRSEGMPGAVMEAMDAGLPVIATDIAGNRSLVIEGHSGLLVPPGDAGFLARAAIKLASDPELRQALGNNSRRLAQSCFNCELEIERYERIYQTITKIV